MRKAYIDANIILRLITGDPPEMAECAARLFQQADEGKLRLIVESVVLAETVWTLSSFYGFAPSDIAPILSTLLVSDGIESRDKLLLLQALVLYQEKNIDFADALLAAAMLNSGIRQVYSFDAHLDRVEGINRAEP